MRIALLACLVLLSGCLSSSPPANEADAGTAPAPPVATVGRPAPLVDPVAGTVSDPIAVDGTTGTTLCADYTVPGLRCILVRSDVQPGLPLAQEVTAIYFSQVNGTALLPSTLTTMWSAPTPATQTLRVQALLLRSCAESCRIVDVVAEATDVSPLRLELPATPLEPGQSVGFAVFGTLAGQQPPKTDAYLSQPFHVEGMLTFLA
jgi:hypothetical protein